MTKYEMLQKIEWRLKEITIKLDNFGEVPINKVESVTDEVRDHAITAQRYCLQILQDGGIGNWKEKEGKQNLSEEDDG